MIEVVRGAVACVLLVGCAFHPGSSSDDANPSPGDGRRDAAADALVDTLPDALVLPAGCFGSQGSAGFYICDTRGAPTVGLALSGAQYNTDTCANGFVGEVLGVDVCLLDGNTVSVSNFQGVGSRPLVIASTSDLTVSGRLDVSTLDGAHHGAGRNPTACNNTGIDGTNNGNGGGGGAGGSFATSGGGGGNSNGNGNGGGATGAQVLSGLRGGCRGGSGGNANGNGGNPGYGGGAVWLVAYGTITITGTVAASGERGYHGSGRGGGGSGGGSGGMILLDAHQLIVTGGKLVADGGGGGGGADNNNNNNNGDGDDGSDPDPTTPSTAAPPGNGNGQGGNGGNGAAQGTPAAGGSPGNNSGGGGGGGGGLGVIMVVGGGVPPASSNISPTAIQAP